MGAPGWVGGKVGVLKMSADRKQLRPGINLDGLLLLCCCAVVVITLIAVAPVMLLSVVCRLLSVVCCLLSAVKSPGCCATRAPYSSTHRVEVSRAKITGVLLL